MTTIYTETTLQWADRGDGVLTIPSGRAAIKWSPLYRAWIVNVLVGIDGGPFNLLHGMQDTEAEAKVYDVFMLRDGKITHQFTGVISVSPFSFPT